jgi:hypothetical protein
MALLPFYKNITISSCLLGIHAFTKWTFFIVSGVLNFGLIFPFWALSKLNLLTVSFENVMALFVVVFTVDLLITYFLARRTMNKVKQQDSNNRCVSNPNGSGSAGI